MRSGAAQDRRQDVRPGADRGVLRSPPRRVVSRGLRRSARRRRAARRVVVGVASVARCRRARSRRGSRAARASLVSRKVARRRRVRSRRGSSRGVGGLARVAEGRAAAGARSRARGATAGAAPHGAGPAASLACSPGRTRALSRPPTRALRALSRGLWRCTASTSRRRFRPVLRHAQPWHRVHSRAPPDAALLPLARSPPDAALLPLARSPPTPRVESSSEWTTGGARDAGCTVARDPEANGPRTARARTCREAALALGLLASWREIRKREARVRPANGPRTARERPANDRGAKRPWFLASQATNDYVSLGLP